MVNPAYFRQYMLTGTPNEQRVAGDYFTQQQAESNARVQQQQDTQRQSINLLGQTLPSTAGGIGGVPMGNLPRWPRGNMGNMPAPSFGQVPMGVGAPMQQPQGYARPTGGSPMFGFAPRMTHNPGGHIYGYSQQQDAAKANHALNSSPMSEADIAGDGPDPETLPATTFPGAANGADGIPIKKLDGKPFWTGERGPELQMVKDGKLTVVPNHMLNQAGVVPPAPMMPMRGFADGTPGANNLLQDATQGATPVIPGWNDGVAAPSAPTAPDWGAFAPRAVPAVNDSLMMLPPMAAPVMPPLQTPPAPQSPSMPSAPIMPFGTPSWGHAPVRELPPGFGSSPMPVNPAMQPPPGVDMRTWKTVQRAPAFAMQAWQNQQLDQRQTQRENKQLNAQQQQDADAVQGSLAGLQAAFPKAMSPEVMATVSKMKPAAALHFINTYAGHVSSDERMKALHPAPQPAQAPQMVPEGYDPVPTSYLPTGEVARYGLKPKADPNAMMPWIKEVPGTTKQVFGVGKSSLGSIDTADKQQPTLRQVSDESGNKAWAFGNSLVDPKRVTTVEPTQGAFKGRSLVHVIDDSLSSKGGRNVRWFDKSTGHELTAPEIDALDSEQRSGRPSPLSNSVVKSQWKQWAEQK